MKKLFLIALMGIALLFSSCAKFPQAQFDTTTAAIQTAKTAGADVYVPQVYQALTDSLKSATVKAEAVKAKWLFPSYKEVNALLAGTTEEAGKAVTKVGVRKAELTAENTKLSTEVCTLVESNKALLAKAPKGKDGKAALIAISTELSVVETTLTDVEALEKNGDLLEANSKIKAANEKALAINAELETAIAKTGIKTVKKAIVTKTKIKK